MKSCSRRTLLQTAAVIPAAACTGSLGALDSDAGNGEDAGSTVPGTDGSVPGDASVTMRPEGMDLDLVFAVSSDAA